MFVFAMFEFVRAHTALTDNLSYEIKLNYNEKGLNNDSQYYKCDYFIALYFNYR
jgi:hypothetical protein